VALDRLAPPIELAGRGFGGPLGASTTVRAAKPSSATAQARSPRSEGGLSYNVTGKGSLAPRRWRIPEIAVPESSTSNRTESGSILTGWNSTRQDAARRDAGCAP